ncbi:MAG TPA: LysR substrate-binding domain-containing protein [Noviherbaspirillum sp.]|nr:LysR substrate-binding domain-containing protein [Noviherbaspirillum sp.]
MQDELLNLPSLDALRGFVAVARRMSITLAAQDLCLTQSAVSRQVQSLEEHLGTPLLLRKHRAIALTGAGRQLFELASPWLSRLAEYTRAVKNEGRPRPVTITASIGVTSLWLLQRLGAFQEAHPHIDVRVAANNRVLDMQQEGIDIAIRYSRPARVPKGAIRLFGEEVVPVANKAVAAKAFKTPAALLQQVLLELDEDGVPWLHWADWLSAKGYAAARPRAYLRFNQYDQVIQAAIEGHGVALGRLPLVQPMLKDGRLVAQRNAKTGAGDQAYWLVTGSESPREEVRIFSEWILEEAKRTIA